MSSRTWVDPAEARAFARLVEAETPRLLRLARRMAPAGLAPEDLVQDTFERAWRARHGFRGEARAATWLHRILVNRLRDVARDRRETAPLPDDEGLETIAIEDPAAVIAAAEREATLRAALTALPDAERAAVALHDGENWTAAEVAEACACSVAAAHKRIQRGRYRLAAALDRGAPERTELPLSCSTARAAASTYLDGEGTPEARAAVEAHLSGCPRCPPVVQALAGVRTALRDGGVPAVPAPLRARLERTVRLEARVEGPPER